MIITCNDYTSKKGHTAKGNRAVILGEWSRGARDHLSQPEVFSIHVWFWCSSCGVVLPRAAHSLPPSRHVRVPSSLLSVITGNMTHPFCFSRNLLRVKSLIQRYVHRSCSPLLLRVWSSDSAASALSGAYYKCRLLGCSADH